MKERWKIALAVIFVLLGFVAGFVFSQGYAMVILWLASVGVFFLAGPREPIGCIIIIVAVALIAWRSGIIKWWRESRRAPPQNGE